MALAAAGELRSVVSSKDTRAYRARIKELTERSGAAAPALAHVLREIQAAVTAGAVVGVVASGAAGAGAC